MPITLRDIVEDYSERGLSLDENGYYTGKRAWDLELEIPADISDADINKIEQQVESFVPVQRWSKHPANQRCTARTMQMSPNGSQHRWRAVVDYSSAPLAARADVGGQGSEQSPAQPNATNTNDNQTSAQNRLPTVSVSWRESQEVFEKDFQDDPVTNAAGDPFDPPIMIARRTAVYTIKFFRLPWTLDWSQRSALIDKVNLNPYTIRGRQYAANRLKIEEVTFSDTWDTYELPNNGGKITTLFHEVTYVIAESLRDWDPEVLNAGRREKIPGPTAPPGQPPNPGTMRVIVDAAGQPVADPVPLTLAGRELQPPGVPTYLKFQAYGRIDFAGIFF